MESLTRPFFHHRRKLSNASNSTTTNGLSFSGKDFYDDVFAGGGTKPKFGGGGGGSGFSSRRVAAEDYAEIFGGRNGTRGSSIPVLDLSGLDERNGSSDFRSSDKQLDYSAIFGGFGVGGGDDDNEVVAMAVPPYEELFDGVKKGKTNKAKTRMSSGINSSLEGSEHFNSSENSKSHSSEASDQIFDGGKQFNMSYHKTGQQRKDGLNGTTHIAQLHAVPGFTCIIDETARLQKTEQDKAKLPIKAEVKLNRSSSDFLQKAELEKAKPAFKLEVDHNINSRDCLQKTEQERAKPPVRREVSDNKSSSDHLQKTEQVKAMPPVNLDVNHNKSSNGNISEGKSGKRAKWQLPTTQASESLVKDKGEHSQYASHSRDNLFDAYECDQKSEHSEVPSTSSSSADLNDNSKEHPKRSESSNYGPKFEDPEKVACGCSTPFSDEELDENSAAAASAAALKKAIEQAQESIRIAKEIMERKKIPVQSSKSCSTYSLKAEDRMEIKHVEEAKTTSENNVKEACESIDNKVVDFSGNDHNNGLKSGEVACSFNHTEKPSTGVQVDMVMNCENVEVAEENGLAMWFTQLLNNGKHRMAALASELVGKKNSITQPLDKDVNDILETKPSKATLECGDAEKVYAVDRILEFRDTDVKLKELGGPEELEKNLDNSNSCLFSHENRVSPTLVFTQEDAVSDNINHGSDKGEKCEKKFEDCHVTTNDRQFELEQLGNALFEDESLKLEQKAFDQELEKNLEDTHVWDVNDCRVDEGEIEKKQEECHLSVGNEDEPRTASGFVSNGKTQEDNPRESYHMQEADEQRSTQSVDEEENQIMIEEEHAWEAVEGRPAWTCQDKEADSGDEDAGSNSANERMENQEVWDVGNIHAEKEGSAENSQENLFQQAVYGEWLNTAGDTYNFYQNANSDDPQETCGCEIENFSEQTNELKTGDHEEKDNLAGVIEQTIEPEGSNNEEKANKVEVSECLYEFEENVKAQEVVEEASRLKLKRILETRSVDHGNAQENIIHSNPEAVASDDQRVDFGFTKINLEAESSKDTDTVRSLNHNGTEEDAIDSDDATEAPCAVLNSSYFDFTDMNGQRQTGKNDTECESSINSENCNGSVYEAHKQNQLEESDEESESAINPESGDNSFHESAENAENAKVDDIASKKETAKDDIEICHEERECIENENEQESSHVSRELEGEEHVGTNPGMKTCHENEEESEYSQFPRELKGEELVESNPDMKMGQSTENNEEVSKTIVKEEKETRENFQKEEVGKDYRKRTEVNKREKEKEKDRIAVERAIREARERAFAEARERAERVAVEKATAEVRQRAMAEAREKLEKASAGTKVATDKSSTEAKLRAERAAVERATAEARERALEKALSQKNISETRMQAERNISGKFPGVSRDGGLKHSFSSSDLERFDGSNSESAQRRKARLERHQRIMERAAKALAEKNLRDVLAQREQAEKNRLAETLDVDIKRWASGKEGNLRALLSTLQYILGPGSGWQPISLTEIITTNAVKKAYRKATLYVHPDKLQQRGASIQQKYICEKVFDLLKAAWNKFNSEER